ncbi:DUF1015 family protein [Kineococcus terrestris]|uniref:DUF1015 family protein n=1 Tax=Kineococcus terrestris TaxID=2044856 RepID=UPI0034DAFB52
MTGGREGARAEAPPAGAPPAGADAPLRPFRGLRYVPDVVGDLGSVLAPPHTDLPRAARAARLQASPWAVTRLERPENDPAPGRAVDRWLAEGALVQDEPSLYVVRQRRAGAEHRFLLASLRVDADTGARVHPHEAVFPDVVRSRRERLRETGVDSEPVLLVHGGGAPAATELVRAAERHGHPVVGAVTSDGGGVRVAVDVWRLDDEDVVRRVTEDLRDVDLVVADGHHRYAAVRAEFEATGVPQELLVAVVDDQAHPLALRPLHRSVPARAVPVLRALAVDVREVRGGPLSDPADAARLTARELTGELDALLVTSTGACLLSFTDGGVEAGAGARVDEALVRAGVEPESVRFTADTGSALAAVSEEVAVVLLPSVPLSRIAATVRGGRLLGRKTTSFAPKPLAGAVLRLR